MYTLPLSKPLYVSLSMPYRGEECRDSVEGEEHEYRILKNSMMASSYPLTRKRSCTALEDKENEVDFDQYFDSFFIIKKQLLQPAS